MSQGTALVAYLRTHGRTSCAELESACDVRSVTKRVSELIRAGQPILKTTERQPDSRGKLRLVTSYELAGQQQQQDLFKPV
jgi:hypothetical protein